jgi:hypothetical protein
MRAQGDWGVGNNRVGPVAAAMVANDCVVASPPDMLARLRRAARVWLFDGSGNERKGANLLDRIGSDIVADAAVSVGHDYAVPGGSAHRENDGATERELDGVHVQTRAGYCSCIETWRRPLVSEMS